MEYFNITRIFLFLLCLTVCIGVEKGENVNPSASTADDSDAVPVFLQEPDGFYYIVKNKPATITCKATHAVKIVFKCVEQWVRPQYHQNMVIDDQYFQSSIEVTKDEVIEYNGPNGYWCECYAWNRTPNLDQPRQAKSRRGVVQIGYLRKRFEREPINTAVELESAVQLQCLPPQGLPAAEVFWLKDGVEIDVKKEINFIISNEGNLIVNQARLQDMGNYTCGASNVASRRLSEPAILTVYLNGGWSTWSQWSECSSKCGKGTKRRSRTCTNPAPLNGGQLCPGDAAFRAVCNPTCANGKDNTMDRQYLESLKPVDGLWSTWSSWSTCSPDCKHHRRRLCDSPAPVHGGRYCNGNDLDTTNCTGGMCRDGFDPISMYSDESENDSTAKEVEDDNVGMYVGLIVAIAVFIVVISIIIVLVRRKSQAHAQDDKKLNKGTQDMLCAQPDITQTVVTIQNHNAVDVPNNNLLGSTEKVPICLENVINTNRSLMMARGGKGSADTLPCKNSKVSLNVSDAGESRPHSMYSEPVNNRHSTISCHLPNNIDHEALVWANVTHTGGRITMPDSGVSLTIPAGAIAKGSSEQLFLAVSRDDKDRPKLTDMQTVLGPVILVGPPGVPLIKPVILSFQHCASIKHGQWTLSVYGSDSPYDEPPTWQSLATIGCETINTPVYVQMDLSHCHVMTDNLMRYTMIGKPLNAGKAVKILRLAAFAPAVPSSIDYNLRVYFVEDTEDALEGVMQVERKLGGRLLDKPKQVLFQHGGGNLCLSIEELGLGWRCKLAANYQEIPFRHIWSGTQSGLHCSFALEHIDRSQHTLGCSIHVFQQSTMASRQVLTISCNLKEKIASSPAHLAKPLRQHTPTVTSSGCNSMVTLDPPCHVFRLPSHTRNKLCQILDPPNARGNDWRMLAQRLSVDRYINYFATKTSPTEHILDLWEARHREESAVTDLMNSLRVMGRMDAAAVLEKEIGAWL